MNNQIQKVVSSETQIFQHEMFGDLRVIQKDNKPYFIGKDVAKALGYADTDKAIRAHCRYPTDQRVTFNTNLTKLDGSYIIKTQDMKVIPESDIYRLIMKSQLDSAIVFQDWVCDVKKEL